MPGRLNVVADLLSRIPEDVRSETGELDGAADSEDLNSTEVCSATIMLSRRSSAETRAKQLKNKEIKAIIDAFEAEAHGAPRFTQRG